jgi:SAM-dependent methyltransferase
MSSKVDEYNKYWRGNPLKGYSLPINKLITATMSKYPHDYVLDLGCGVGNNIKWLSDKWPESKFTGVDISDVAIEYAKSKVPTAEFICGSIEKVSVPVYSDIIFLIGVLEHIRNLTSFLKSVREIPCGFLFVRTIYNNDRPKGFNRPGFGDNQEEWNYTPDEWETIFEKNGFEIVERVTGVGLWPGRDLAWVLKVVTNEKSS